MLNTLDQWLEGQGLSPEMADQGSWILAALLVAFGAWLIHLIARRVVLALVQMVIKRTRTRWDDVLINRRVFHHLAHLAPAMLIYASAGLFDPVQSLIERACVVYMLLAGIFVFNSFLNAIGDIYRDFEISRQRPIRGYIQIAKIILFIFIGLIAISVILDRSPWLLLSGFGAMTAVVILVFKDTILGFVASIQISANDMVQIDDWIEMPQYGADGPVIDMTLHTVKVRNWDKTITTIPTYALISQSFKNWRGMTESGGRRMKRSVHLDMTSVKFCDEAMLERFRKFQYLGDYLDDKLAEIEEYNRTHEVDLTEVINGRRLTNLGTFRAYVSAYLENHPRVHKELTHMVRQLAPGPEGIPIEVYAFSTDQRWIYYESIQADIFDHILAVIPEFELRVFQSPTGGDIQKLSSGPDHRPGTNQSGAPEGAAER